MINNLNKITVNYMKIHMDIHCPCIYTTIRHCLSRQMYFLIISINMFSPWINNSHSSITSGSEGTCFAKPWNKAKPKNVYPLYLSMSAYFWMSSVLWYTMRCRQIEFCALAVIVISCNWYCRFLIKHEGIISA